MQRPKLLLHVGTHKTGTTAIQESLDRNRSWLAKKGVSYPKLDFPGRRSSKQHYQLAKALGKTDVSAELEHYRQQIEQAASGARVTVLSAERTSKPFVSGEVAERDDFFKRHSAYLKRLRRLLRAFDISVLIYFRYPDRFAVSAYKNKILNGNRHRPDFLETVLRDPWLYDYERRTEIFREVFESVEIRSYEAEAETGLVAGFYAVLDLERLPPKGVGESRPRATLGNRATLWLRRAAAEDASKKRHRQRVLFAAENPRLPVFAEAEPSTLWPSDAAFSAFVDSHRSAYALLSHHDPKPPACPTATWTDEMHEAAQRAFEEWRRLNAKRLEKRVELGLTNHWDQDPA